MEIVTIGTCLATATTQQLVHRWKQYAGKHVVSAASPVNNRIYQEIGVIPYGGTSIGVGDRGLGGCSPPDFGKICKNQQ